MEIGTVKGLNITGSVSTGTAAVQATQLQSDTNKFKNLVESLSSKASDKSTVTNVSSSQIVSGSHINGDYTQGFHNAFTSEADKNAKPQGAAANFIGKNGETPTIDKTSALYEQSMELENYLVKSMLQSMRNTISKSSLFGSDNDYAMNTYEDMLYDNYAEQLTKSSNFGLADQIYLELSGQR